MNERGPLRCAGLTWGIDKMVWGRLDDGFWDHAKTRAVLARGDGLQALAGVSLLIAFINRHWRTDGRFDGFEFAMLVQRSKSEADVLLDVLVDTIPDGHEHGFVERRGSTYVLHDAIEYMDPKVRAGKKGGRKSGESRRRKSNREAGAEANTEAETNGSEARIPISRSPGSRSERDLDLGDLSLTRDQITQVDDVVQAAMGIGLARPGNELARRIAAAIAPSIPRARLITAIDATSKADHPNWTYLVQCLENPAGPRRSKRVSKIEELDRAGKEWAAGEHKAPDWMTPEGDDHA